uniref:Major facilitator superfamily (MFS) profile domain-containing protein n=1 Tax=Acrobeloides nanus TaxID=290746 RepID=A0A914CEZ4_9BILA
MVQIKNENMHAITPPSEPPNLNRLLYSLVIISIIGAFLFGYDTSIISSAMLYLKNSERIKPVNHIWQEILVGAIPAFAGIGSLLAGPISDSIGRKKTIMISSVIYALGTLVCALAITKILLLVGRILLGLAVGLSSMTIPVYLSESTPTHVRGKFVTGFNLTINIGQVISNIMAGLLAFIDPENIGWRLMFACASIPAIIQFIGASVIQSSDPIFNSSVQNFHNCAKHINCDYCVTDDRCGFCAHGTTGYCLPLDPEHADQGALTGYCAVSNDSEVHTVNGERYEWMDVYCRTSYTIIPIILMMMYLLCFSVGLGPMPWLLNSEFYPLWARGTCVAITTFTNWLFDLIISLTFLSLTEFATKYGTFYIYTVITFVAFLIFWKYVPETKGCSLDEVEMLFMNPREREIFQQNLRNRILGSQYELKNMSSKLS